MKHTRTLKSITVELDDTKYTLREMTGLARGEFFDLFRELVPTNDDGQPTGKVPMANVIKSQISLVSRSLYTDAGVAVLEAEIVTYPADTLAMLYQAAQKLNGMEAPAEGEAPKKDSPANA